MKATLRNLRVSPRKTRLVADLVRGKSVEEAISILTFTNRSASKPIKELVRSAWSNAEEKDADIAIDDLFIDRIFVDEGATMKRFRPRAQGRATRINKRTSHVTCVLGRR